MPCPGCTVLSVFVICQRSSGWTKEQVDAVHYSANWEWDETVAETGLPRLRPALMAEKIKTWT